MAQPQTLGMMLQMLDAQMQHAPQHRADRSFKTAMLNKAILHYSEDALWPFLCVPLDLSIYATVEGSSSATIAINTATNARLVTGTGTSFAAAMEGQTMVMPDGTEQVIVYVASTTTLYLRNAYGTTITGEEDWSIEFRQYRMDTDVSEILGAQFTDGAKETVPLLSRRDLEDYELDMTTEGTVLAMVESNTLDDRAPFAAPTLTEGAASSGSLTQGHRIDYCTTIINEGRESAPSAIASITLANASSSVTVAGLEDLRYNLPSSGLESGLRKAVYRRNVTQNSSWVRVGIVAAATSSFADTAALPAIYDEIRDIRTLDQAPTVRRHLRVYHATTSDRTLRVRYKASPTPMVKDADIPRLWPPEYHDAFWMHALGAVLKANGDRATAKDWEAEADAVIRRARTRLLSETARPTVAGNWAERGSRRGTERYINFGKA